MEGAIMKPSVSLIIVQKKEKRQSVGCQRNRVLGRKWLGWLYLQGIWLLFVKSWSFKMPLGAAWKMEVSPQREQGGKKMMPLVGFAFAVERRLQRLERP